MTTDDPKAASEAQSLINHMEDFSFIVCLLVWYDLLFEVNLISKKFQGKSTDIGDSVKIPKCLDFLGKFRGTGFVNCVISGKEIADELEIGPAFLEKTFRRKKNVLINESSNEVRSSPKEIFKRDVFYLLVAPSIHH